MAQGMNGAWLALGVAGAVAAAGSALGRGGSRAKGGRFVYLGGGNERIESFGSGPFAYMFHDHLDPKNPWLVRTRTREAAEKGALRVEDTLRSLGILYHPYVYQISTETHYGIEAEHARMLVGMAKPKAGKGSRAMRGVPDDAWGAYTDAKGRRWATDGAVMVREDAPALAASAKGMYTPRWWTPENPNWSQASEGIRGLLDHYAGFAVSPLPHGIEMYFNKRYGPLLKKSSKVQISSAQFKALERGIREFPMMEGPVTAFDKNGEPWALVMPLLVDGFGKDTEVVNQHGEPRTVKV